MRAEEYRIDASPNLSERAMHFVVYRVERGYFEEAAAYARLVRCENNVIAGMVQTRDRLQTSRKRPPFVGCLDEALAVVIDHAVTIEYDQFHRGRDTNICG